MVLVATKDFTINLTKERVGRGEFIEDDDLNDAIRGAKKAGWLVKETQKDIPPEWIRHLRRGPPVPEIPASPVWSRLRRRRGVPTMA